MAIQTQSIMHQSIPTAPMPPRALSFFSLEWQIRGGGDTLAAKCPAAGTKEEGKCPAPGIVRPQSTLQQFSFIAQ